MQSRTILRTASAAAAAGALAAVAVAGPAGAVDDTKPAPTCAGLAFKDAANDQNHVQVPEAERNGNTEIINGFLKYDPAKGAEATTYNITVKSLKAEVPSTWTTQTWNAYYIAEDDTYHYVRGILDFSGAVTYEYGNFTPNPTGVGLTGASVYEGKTAGKLFEGDQGVIQLVVPPDKGGQAGKQLTGLYASSGQGRTLPSDAPGYARGTVSVLDTAPDDAPETAPGKYKVATCPGDPGAPGGSGGSTGGTTGGSTGGSGGGATPVSGPVTSGPLPVRLVRTSAKAPKRKSLSLKLRSSENVTALAARLRKGKRVLASGKLASINGNRTLKLKLKRKAKRGKYVLDLVGNDAKGQRRAVSLKLKLR